MALLEVDDLHTHFYTEEGIVRAVDGVSLSVERGEVLCLVGESGSGKSVASLSILGLVPDPPGRITGGRILFSADGGEPEDLVSASASRMRAIRGKRIAMIFQDPMTSLNPYMKVGAQLLEVLEIHERLRGAEATKRVVAMLDRVGIPAPDTRLHDYPHQISGGMRQRVMIAMALLCEPDLLIADEPTTALDVTIQAQILDLIEERTRDMDTGVIFITHDLGVVAKMADRVAVMYAGRLVEEGTVDAVFSAPRHPYTAALRASIPRVDQASDRHVLTTIPGLPPSPGALPEGCPFHPRCDHAIDVCRTSYPERREVTYDGSRQAFSCHVDLEERA
ncbi:MAG TPA: ABC transporter ATP-binding protein [Polyangiaceae bacterium]|nr:ABC transporter ATP-binding protein [Polyangiaceae bacterium]